MSSSSLCSYCYCIAGKPKCVKPKCMLRQAGCEVSNMFMMIVSFLITFSRSLTANLHGIILVLPDSI